MGDGGVCDGVEVRGGGCLPGRQAGGGWHRWRCGQTKRMAGGRQWREAGGSPGEVQWIEV